MSETLNCHSSAHCKADQSVKRLDGTMITTTVHNIREMRSDRRLEGFTKDDRDIRHGVIKAPASDTWVEEY